MKPLVESFAPLARPDARLLILGSMPGVASLQAQQYYAHPHNLFWRILATACQFDPQLPYAARVQALQASGIAVWDVLAACHRPGSLDARIDGASAVANDFPAFLAAHPDIHRVCFNGAAAATLFQRHVLPQVANYPLEYLRLPSTSPANAGIPAARKYAAWLAALTPEKTTLIQA